MTKSRNGTKEPTHEELDAVWEQIVFNKYPVNERNDTRISNCYIPARYKITSRARKNKKGYK